MFGVAYAYELSGLPKNNLNLFVYGIALDVLWRQLKLMKSLDDSYYDVLSPLESGIWGGISVILGNLI